jgi:hypothetical protein
MGLGRLNPGCNTCGCVPVIDCPPMAPCFCHSDESCVQSEKFITAVLQFATFSLSDPNFVSEYIYDEYEVGIDCSVNVSTQYMPNPFYSGVGAEPLFIPISLSITPTLFSIAPIFPSNPFGLFASPAAFEFSQHEICDDYISAEMLQTSFPNEPWSGVYPWLDENGWLTPEGHFLVLKSVTKSVI